MDIEKNYMFHTGRRKDASVQAAQRERGGRLSQAGLVLSSVRKRERLGVNEGCRETPQHFLSRSKKQTWEYTRMNYACRDKVITSDAVEPKCFLLLLKMIDG